MLNNELLLPVGNLDMALAAIHNGADAIYMGVPGFNARGRSYDFQLTELQSIIELCHLYGVKVNLALNIVIFQDELDSVIQLLKQILPLQPDAFIVQDIGLVRIIKYLHPQQVVHASTQMTITNDLAIEFLKPLGIRRFVLGRENSLSEIRLIKEKTKEELEVFVHGALCVSYSGQCFTSESLGGRSANRGQCAQSCRFSYDLIVDGEKKELKNRNFLVSPQDLCGIEEIPELINIGVTSFKVEGRLKTPEYVASAAQSYRKVIHAHLSENKKPTAKFAISELKKNMATQYSRGFFSGWLHGVNHQKLVDGTFSAHRGFNIGKLVGIDAGQNSTLRMNQNNKSIDIQLQEGVELANGDGILWSVYSSKGGPSSEFGSFIFSVEKLKNNIVRIGINKDLQLNQEMIGSDVYLNHNKDLKSQLLNSFQNKTQFKRIPVHYLVELQLNHPMRVTITDGYCKITEQTESPLQLAQQRPLTEAQLQDELSALSGTVFELAEIKFQWLPENTDGVQPSLFMNHREIKQIRQKLTEKLATQRKSHTVNGLKNGGSVVSETEPVSLNTKDLQDSIARGSRNNESLNLILNSNSNSNETSLNSSSVVSSNVTTVQSPKFNILLRDKIQVDDFVQAVQNKQISTQLLDAVILDFEFGRDYSASLQQLKSLNIKTGLATTRILKPQEYNNLKILKSLAPDVILVRNLGALYYFSQLEPAQIELRGDFSLNVTNNVTADFLLNKGLSSLCLSYDLNQKQVEKLLLESASIQRSSYEITLHQTIPSFHMEHCVFAAFLSQGTSYKDCGKPCEKHTVQLKDQFGHLHWIKPDQECRNTMFNAKAQTAARFVAEWMDYGVGYFRYEALNERGSELIGKIQAYLSLLSKEKSLDTVLEDLSVLESYGLGEGTLNHEHNYKSRKKSNPNKNQNPPVVRG